MLPENNNIKPLWTMIQLKAKRSAILSQASNSPDTEEDFRRACSSYENHSSDLLNQAYQEYTNDFRQPTSLYHHIPDDNRFNLYIYDTESEREEMKELKIPGKFTHNAYITYLPNGELFCTGYKSDIILRISKDNRARVVPSGTFRFGRSFTYFKRNVYCFGAEYENYSWPDSRRFDLDANRLIGLTPVPWSGHVSCSTLFNGNIIISWYEEENLLLYSVDLDSFSIISSDFGWGTSKILVNAEKRLYLFESCDNWSRIYESSAEDEYTWQWIAESTISIYNGITYWSYNKRMIYILFSSLGYCRMYYKFDLDKKAFFEIAYYDEHVAIGIIGSKLQAIECYDHTFKLDPDHAAAYINKGYSLSYIGNRLQTTEYKNKDIELNPENVKAYQYKGKALAELGRNLEAIECYNKAIELDPQDPESCYVYKGDALYDLGRNLEAIECYSNAIRLENREKIYKAYYKKGCALHRLGRFIEAIDSFNELIILRPYKALPYYLKGNTLYDLGRDLEAVEYYDKAIELDPERASFYFNEAKALYNIGRFLDAIECHSKAIELDPNNPLYLCYRASLLSNLNQEIEALQDFNKAYELIKNTQTSKNSNVSFKESIMNERPSQDFPEFLHILFKLQESAVAFIEEFQKLKNVLLNNPDLLKEAEESEKIVKIQHSQIIKNAIRFLHRNKDVSMQNQTKQIEKDTIKYQNTANDIIAQKWLSMQ